jgi:hypothetical protein
MEQNTTPQPVPASQSTPVPPTTAKPVTGRVSASLILFLLLAFPPIAWYFMWRDKTYHHWFGKLLIISGILALGITLSSFAAIGTSIDRLYASLGVTNAHQSLITMTTYLGIAFAIIQVLFGLYLQHRMKKQPSMSRSELSLAVFLLAASFYVAFLPLIFIVQDLYPAIAALYQGTNY